MRRQLIIVFVVGAAASLAAGTARSQCLQLVADVAYHFTWDAMPAALAVAVSGDLAYFNTGPVLHVADVSDPTDPQVLGEVTLRGDILAIAVDDSMAYVAMGDSGVSVVDVGNSWAPEEISSIETTHASLDVAVSDRTLYVADGNAGLGVFDVVDPAHPVPVSRRTMGYALSVAVVRSDECSYAVVANTSGIRLLDVSDPRSPRRVGHHRAYTLRSITTSGGYVFAIDRSSTLHVIDARSPSAPVEVNSLGMNPPGGLVEISSSHAYVGGPFGISAVDLSGPMAPTQQVSSGWVPVEDVAPAGGHVYAAFNDPWSALGGLAVFRACDGAPADFGSMTCGSQPRRPRGLRLSEE